VGTLLDTSFLIEVERKRASWGRIFLSLSDRW
jgi:hypothetical protein